MMVLHLVGSQSLPLPAKDPLKAVLIPQKAAFQFMETAYKAEVPERI